MPQARNRDIDGDSHRPTSRRRRQNERRRRRRRRLIPLVSAVALILLLAVIVSASLASGSPAEADGAQDGGSSDYLADEASNTVVVERARELGANEMGKVLVLMYHLIEYTDSEYSRTPEDFRQDIADLKAAGYYPVTVRDYAAGKVDVPAGKSPVVITFDDSSGGQYRILEDGTVDPKCAVGIMQQAVEDGDWASRASFFVLLDVDYADRVLFGQPEYAQQKLQQLVEWGYEVGSHTVSHLNLKKASAALVQEQLYESQRTIEELIGDGYDLVSLAPPFGEYPTQQSLLKSGEYDGQAYTYEDALNASGGPYFSPFSDKFRAYHITRLEVDGTRLEDALADFEQSPGLRYISDGDPTTVAIPHDLDGSLGSIRDDLDLELIQY